MSDELGSRKLCSLRSVHSQLVRSPPRAEIRALLHHTLVDGQDILRIYVKFVLV